MSWSYYKTFKFPGGSLNLSKSGISASFGFKGNRININHKGRVLYTARYNGFQYRERLFQTVSNYREDDSFSTKAIDFLIAQACILIPFLLMYNFLSVQITNCTKCNCENGVGTATLNDGTTYAGSFKNGKFDGKGTLFGKKGKTLKKGNWVEGRLRP
jgi:hypothetical protein